MPTENSPFLMINLLIFNDVTWNDRSAYVFRVFCTAGAERPDREKSVFPGAYPSGLFFKLNFSTFLSQRYIPRSIVVFVIDLQYFCFRAQTPVYNIELPNLIYKFKLEDNDNEERNQSMLITTNNKLVWWPIFNFNDMCCVVDFFSIVFKLNFCWSFVVICSLCLWTAVISSLQNGQKVKTKN